MNRFSHSVKKVVTSYKLGEMSGGFSKMVVTSFKLEKCLEGLVKLVITSYRLGEMSGGFCETGFN